MVSNSQKYITVIPNPYPGARLGHKLKDIFTAFILAEWFNLQYLHNPIPDYGDGNDWENFLGLGEKEKLFADVATRDVFIVSCSPLLGIRRLRSKSYFVLKSIIKLERIFRKVIYNRLDRIKFINEWSSPYWHGVPFDYIEKLFSNINDNHDEIVYCFLHSVRVTLTQVNILGKEGRINQDIYNNVLNKLRKKYHQQQHPDKISSYNPELINIAVPIRREDATLEDGRFIPLKFYENIIKQLIEVFQEQSYELHVYSLASQEDGQEIINSFTQKYKQVKFHINEPAMKVMHHLIISDILIVDHSSFHQISGFLSQGIKLYHPHGYIEELDDDTWIPVDYQGIFNQEDFVDAVNNLRLDHHIYKNGQTKKLPDQLN
ncbi:MAG: hypothetical protein F6K41_15450 [Symploca sp. SIO3E6]|nr:hypothetical protein [Caldora sp. SIO3E6]